jgi:hypothetical protein
VQVTETELPVGWTDRLKSFVDLDPKNAQAHYFYAIANWRSQLKIAVDLDPRLGGAYLELGILASQQGDLP